VAIINWKGPRTEVTSFEKHKLTDEAFLLIEGTVHLMVFKNDREDFDVFQMKKNSVYNILKNTWHAVVLEGKCKVVVVEKRDTHLNDDTRRVLTPDEKEKITQALKNSSFDKINS